MLAKEKYTVGLPLYGEYNSSGGQRDFYGDYDGGELIHGTYNIMNDNVDNHASRTTYTNIHPCTSRPIYVYIKNAPVNKYLDAWLYLREELACLPYVKFIMIDNAESCYYPGSTTVFKIKAGRHGGEHNPIDRPVGHMFNYYGLAAVDSMRDWILDVVN